MVNQVSESVYSSDYEKALNQGETVKVQIVGKDMRPLFSEKDYVMVAPVPEATKRHTTLKRGDIVLFYHHHLIKLHRIVHTNGTLLRIKGDGNYGKYEKVTCSDVIGVVTEGTYWGGIKFRATAPIFKLVSKFWVHTHFFRLHTVLVFRVLTRKLKKSNKK